MTNAWDDTASTTSPFASVRTWPVASSKSSHSAMTSADEPGPAAAIWACRSAYWPATAAARPAGRRDLRVAVEAGEGGQRGVEAVVAPAGHGGPAVVDQLAVRVGRRVGA